VNYIAAADQALILAVLRMAYVGLWVVACVLLAIIVVVGIVELFSSKE